ncbi:MAG: hypothetical protein PHO15_07490, partial [Eubacteriales bacterium]|nr:hypothetical protein [Eubacteriales bacterium]
GGYHSPVSDTGNALQNNRPSFSVNDTRMIENLGSGDIGLDNEYPPEPSPSPMPPPPPVEDGNPDMENYEEDLSNYWDAHDAWEEEVANIDANEDAIKKELESLGKYINDPEPKYIIDNVLKNSKTISSEMIQVDYETQKDFKYETDFLENHVQDVYNAYVTAGSVGAGFFNPTVGALVATLGVLFGDSPEAPIIKEGDYVMYRTDYFEPYGFLWETGQKHHNVLILAEADENGNPVDSNHTYVFDSCIDMFSSEGLPAYYNFFYEYGE